MNAHAKPTTLAVLLLALLALGGCMPSKQPPVPSPLMPRARLLRPSQFRIGVLDFGSSANDTDQKHNVAPAKALPAMLASELKKGGRFSVHEGGGIRAGGGAISEQQALQHVDAYVSGTIVSESDKETCFEVRLANAESHEILFAKNACVGVTRSDTTYAPDRAAMTRLAEELSRTVKEVGNAKVTAVDGRLIYLDKGEDADIMRGMVAVVTATGDATTDDKLHTAVAKYTKVTPDKLKSAKEPVIVGALYIVSVEKDYAIGVLYDGDYVVPGDTLFFR